MRFALQHKHMKYERGIINFSTSVVGQMFSTYSLYAGTKGVIGQFTSQLGICLHLCVNFI
jgi:3-oxoacyl-[acyl-carrier protein] reductase